MPSNIHVGNLTKTADKVHEMVNDYHIFWDFSRLHLITYLRPSKVHRACSSVLQLHTGIDVKDNIMMRNQATIVLNCLLICFGNCLPIIFIIF